MNEYEAVITLRNSLYWLDKTNISNEELEKTQEAIEILAADIWDKAKSAEQKALLVINMPRNCYECLFCMFTADRKWECFQTGKRPEELFTRADWCPLIEMPKRKQIDWTINIDGKPKPIKDEKAEGWNECLDMLEGNK